jgi:hypothetical protein
MVQQRMRTRASEVVRAGRGKESRVRGWAGARKTAAREVVMEARGEL